MKKMKKGCTGCLILVLLAFVIFIGVKLIFPLFSSEDDVNAEVQKEISTVEEAWNHSVGNAADENAAQKSETVPIDIEKTMRLFHILNDGYSNAENMQEYLKFLAMQDYRGIPQDVIEAKKKMLPFLINMRKAEKNLDEVESKKLWSVVSDMDNLSSAVFPVISGVATGNPVAVAQAGSRVASQMKSKWKEYEETVEKEAREKLEEVQAPYLEYLEEWTLVYMKYMDEWNRLCLMRDQAYLAINRGNVKEASTVLDVILKKYPTDRESILLKSFCLLFDSSNLKVANNESTVHELSVKELLENYLEKNPDRTAPALVLLGTYYMKKGETEKALMLYDKASVEYPQQVEELLDMYNSYSYRNHLYKSVEGIYVQKMYKSMMEGFGFFSSNFQKALIEYRNGNYEAAKEEVLMHFFRRGNQEKQDYLIDDMEYVEQNMPKLLDMIFEEHAFLDLQTYNPTMSFSDKLAIEVENRSDKKLSNVRLFICLHLTDMYKNDYLVKKVETTINNIEPHSKVDFGKIQLDYEIYGKKKNHVDDIVSVRAIIMTDNLIIWVDQDQIKRNEIQNQALVAKTSRHSFEKMDNLYHLKQKISGKNILNEVDSRVSFDKSENEGWKIMSDKKMVFHFPRVLDVVNPYFSFRALNRKDRILPTSVSLNGDAIDVEFEKSDSLKARTVPLFVSSKYGSFYLDVQFDENGNPVKISQLKF